MKTIELRRGKAASLQRFHPWVFSGAIGRLDDDITDGDLVRLVDHEGQYLATGHYERGSIAVRILTFDDEVVDAAFWHGRLEAAYAVRMALRLTGQDSAGRPNDVFRLVHGEGDRLPGLVVDVYGPTAVVQAHSAGMHRARRQIAQAIVDATGGLVSNVYYKSEGTLPYMVGAEEAKAEFLIGETAVDVATECGLRFHIDWLRGQKTGFFIDQRENRRLLESYAAGRDVLNMFCYTGGFSVYALRGGARSVHSVDSSAKAMALTEGNVALNFPSDTRHEGFTKDAFDFLSALPHHSAYDLIVLDPPAFAKHRDATVAAVRGYTRLNAIAFERIRHGGILFTFSCSQAISKEQFRLAVFTAAARSGRHVRILHQLHQPADHPINIYHPEGEYLKGLVLYVE